MALVIRDDDLSFWTKPQNIDKIYKPLFDKKIKVSFATIPFSVEMFHAGDFSTFYQETNEQPLGKNKELVEYIQEKIDEGLVEIMLHGYNHLYAFKCEGSINIATKANLEICRKQDKPITFLGEYNYHDYETLEKKTKLAKEYLENIFRVKIKNFVPPSNQINKAGIKAINKHHLNLSGLIGKKYDREVTLKGLFTFIDRVLWKIRYKNILYPKIANYAKHKELVGYAFTPSTNLKQYYEQLLFCKQNNYPFVIATHYWELEGKLKEEFYAFIDKALSLGMQSKFLKEVLV